MDRRKILLIAAAVVALLGTTLVFLYVRGADNRAEDRFETVEVLKAVAIIEPGETIDQAAANGKLALQPVSQADLLPNYQVNIDNLTGLVATTRIYPGEQIISDKFGSEAMAESPLQIPEGQLAVSINLTDPARVAGFVNPGSDVALFLSSTDATTGGYTRLLLPRVTVLGVGSTTPTTTTTTTAQGAQTTENLPRTLMTLAVSQAQAEKVLFASANGELSFGLLTENSTVRPGPGANAGNLFR